VQNALLKDQKRNWIRQGAKGRGKKKERDGQGSAGDLFSHPPSFDSSVG